MALHPEDPDIYAVGDLQGCRAALDRLLIAIQEAPNPRAGEARLWFAGDLVNRGPDSLGVLRVVQGFGERAVAVLGNHDLNLLAVAAGVRRQGRSDTLAPILSAPDRESLLEWLRHRPLAHYENGHLMVHAGVLPSWRVEDTLALAGEVETQLRGPHWRAFLGDLFGNLPNAWNPNLRGADRWRVIVNALTRLRFANAAGAMELTSKEAASLGPAGYVPWFELPQRKTADNTLICGHWSTLGLINRPNLLALDTGCVWGGKLTAVRLRDRHLIQIDCAPGC
jgi:bis(5'-nucleosyl)-tetraphosphatase (symmetrical)